MNLSRDLVCKEPELQKEIKSWKKRIAGKERLLSDTITDYASLKVCLDDFYEKEYWPKLGIYQDEVERLWEALVKGNDGPSLVSRIPPDLKETKPKYGAGSLYRQMPFGKSPASGPEGNELKRLYRNLAKLYHPDSATDPEDKEFCHSRMAAINAAFSEGDIETLRRYLKRSEAELGASGQSSLSRLRALKIDAQVLDEISRVYARRMEDLKKSPIYNLREETRQNAKKGIDILAHLAKKFKERIKTYRDVLQTLRPRKLQHESSYSTGNLGIRHASKPTYI